MPNGGNKCVFVECLLRQKAPHGGLMAANQDLAGIKESRRIYRLSQKPVIYRLFWRPAWVL